MQVDITFVRRMTSNLVVVYEDGEVRRTHLSVSVGTYTVSYGYRTWERAYGKALRLVDGRDGHVYAAFRKHIGEEGHLDGIWYDLGTGYRLQPYNSRHGVFKVGHIEPFCFHSRQLAERFLTGIDCYQVG